MRNQQSNLITPNWNVPSNIKAFTTTSNLDFSFSNSNRADEINALLKSINAPQDIIFLKQIHGTDAINLDFVDYKNSKYTPITEADSSFTTKQNRVCAVLTADCLPVLITNKQGTKVAAIHAGWRGLVNGVIESTINSMNENPKNLIVWCGPAIGPEKFEVGSGVKEVFLEKAKNKSLVEKGFEKLKEQKKYLANLNLLALDRLLDIGLEEDNIFCSNNCTYSELALFHSYRRNKTTKRMASFIWLS